MGRRKAALRDPEGELWQIVPLSPLCLFSHSLKEDHSSSPIAVRFAVTLPARPAATGGAYIVEGGDHPTENKQRLFIQSLLYSKAVSPHHWHLAESQRQQGVGELFRSEREGRLQV